MCICLSGKHIGPYGGDGGYIFDSGDFNGTGCYLGFISGKAGMRLDQLSLHWKCPREREFISINTNNPNSLQSRSHVVILSSILNLVMCVTQLL